MLLRIEHLSKTYPNGTRALDDVSLAIPQGMFGLLGPNGAGKSTLMRTIATLQEPYAGAVTLGESSTGSGPSIDVLRDKESVRRTLGYLPQEFGVYPKVTAEDLLDHFAVLKGITDKSERKRIVDALFEQTNLEGARRNKLGSYSGGMRQRFGIAVALLGNPKLIIVDEPTAGLDPEERIRFRNLIAEASDQVAVLLSTHICEDIEATCDRVGVLTGGTLVFDGAPGTLMAKHGGAETLEDAYARELESAR